MAPNRKNSPALYELVGRRYPRQGGVPTGEPDAPVQPVAEPDVDERPPLIGPGRVVRLPVGYFFFGAALVIGAGVGGWALGYQQREREYQAELRAQAEAATVGLIEPLDGPEVNPDLLSEGFTPVGSPARPAGAAGTAGTTARTPEARPGDGAERAPAGPRGVVVQDRGQPDPRQAGSNYAIVASLGRDRAVELAEFLGERGVEVAVLSPNNAGLSSVVSLRGFPEGTYRSEARREHDSMLRRLGREWASRGGWRRDFDDSEMFWMLYSGR